MTREEFIKQRCEIDKITEEEFEKNYRVVEYNCGQLYCKGYRCLDLDDLLKENQELKKQVEVSNELVAQGTLTEMKLRNEGNRWKKEYQDTYKDVRIEIKEYKTQQKEFIKFLEDEIQTIENKIFNLPVESNERNYLVNIGNKLIEILQKYKEIIGGE